MKRQVAAAVIIAIPLFGLVQFIRGAGSEPASFAGMTEVVDRAVMVPAFGMPVKQITMATVHSISGEEIGDIRAVLTDEAGELVAVILALGGLFGLGADLVIVRLDQLRPHRDGFLIEMTEDQARTLPAWDA